jgi:N-acylneuraminate cytidylyltransferase
MMRLLALIPARGGSKRLPRKNIRLLGETPLIIWSVNVIKDIPEICSILISTDDTEIAKICLDNGINIPWLRPESLSGDDATSVDVAIHALDWYESAHGKIDGLLLLQPTSPFRTRDTIIKGIKLFSQHGRKTVIGVTPTSEHPMWALKTDGDYLTPFMAESDFKKNSQQLPPAYHINGSFYLISPDELRSEKQIVTDKSIPLIIDSIKESIDIDTELDFKLAEYFLDL